MAKHKKQATTDYAGHVIRHRENGTYQADFMASGIRKRKVFDTIEAAKIAIDQWKIEIINKGRAAFSIDDRDRMELAEWRKDNPEVPLHDVFSFWTKHHPTSDAKTISEIVDAFLITKTGRRGNQVVERREATVQNHTKRLTRLSDKDHPIDCKCFVCKFGSMAASEITTGVIEQWLDAGGWNGRNRQHYIGSVRALFNFAVRKGHCSMNPADPDHIELPTIHKTEVIAMSADAVDKYLQALSNTCPTLLAREAISFFCGLRPTELNRLDWQNVSITGKTITVTGATAKIQGHRRVVDMPDNLLSWIAPSVKSKGAVWEGSPRMAMNNRQAAAKAAGVFVPPNAGRHAFASYHLAKYKSGDKTATQMGHSSTKLLNDTYKGLSDTSGSVIDQAAGDAYFEIMPKWEGNAIEFRKAS